MKIVVLTVDLNVANGWGRYSSDLTHALRSRGVEVILVKGLLPDPLTYKTYFLAPWYAWKLRMYTKDCQAIHAFIEPYSCIAYWLSLFTGTKYFITAHGTWSVLPYSFSFAKRYLHDRSFVHAEKVICVSKYTRRRLASFGLTNLSVINNGVNFEKFYSPEVSGTEREDTIVSVGALNPAKGYHVSLSAFAKAASEVKTLRYCIVGNQSNVAYMSELKQQATSQGVAERVTFLKDLSHEELLNVYRKAKLFLLPSLTLGSDFEGFGLVYLEAGACGLPVIGSLDSGAEDAIIDGITGFLVPQNDAAVIARAIVKVFQDSTFARTLGDNGIRRARENDWGRVVESYLTTYRSAQR